jgi:hypothetical protein
VAAVRAPDDEEWVAARSALLPVSAVGAIWDHLQQRCQEVVSSVEEPALCFVELRCRDVNRLWSHLAGLRCSGLGISGRLSSRHATPDGLAALAGTLLAPDEGQPNSLAVDYLPRPGGGLRLEEVVGAKLGRPTDRVGPDRVYLRLAPAYGSEEAEERALCEMVAAARLPLRAYRDSKGLGFVTTSDTPFETRGTAHHVGLHAGLSFALSLAPPEDIAATMVRVLQARRCERVLRCRWSAVISTLLAAQTADEAHARAQVVLRRGVPADWYEVSLVGHLADVSEYARLLALTGAWGSATWHCVSLAVDDERGIEVRLDGNATGFRVTARTYFCATLREYRETLELPVEVEGYYE